MKIQLDKDLKVVNFWFTTSQWEGKIIDYTPKSKKELFYIQNKCFFTLKDGDFIIEDQENIENLLKDKNIDIIRQKYKDLIFARYSLTDQLNMWNEAIEIMALVAFEKRDYTEEEATRLIEIQAAKKWIDEQRQACQAEIDAL